MSRLPRHANQVDSMYLMGSICEMYTYIIR